MNQSIYDFSLKTIDGQQFPLSNLRGKAALIVNVASKCGLTPQYDALEKLHERFHAKGLEVLGFPANEFGAQEPGSNTEIQEFCRTKFGVKFKMFEKIVVKGTGIHPLYQYLIDTQPEAVSPEGRAFEDKLKGYGITRAKKNDILWNFEKFLIGRDGKIIARFNPDVTPDSDTIVKTIELALGKS
jgi:glutathione peroxidase